ncbi:nuclear transport factor 2 family protein [Nocardioides lijunqiniae]|uniref:nuclear transport factor 2 family protein n=1 Tax=Nocardioides lijunqiniae TaxID=2760832 RepID=UPI0018775BED|nr:nuclear transport factor 2 family protein [Nocardioides lijunqiniae]
MLNHLVRRNYTAALRALERGDLDTLLKNVDPACELTFVGESALSAPRLVGGNIRAWFERYVRLIPERRFEIMRFASAGPLWRREVAAHVVVRGRLADGSLYDNQFAHFLSVHKGRIVSDLVLEDTQRWAGASDRLAVAGIEEASASPIR